MSLAPVCILAGGLGTRLGDAAEGLPKPLVGVADEPFVFHQLRLLKRHGADRVVLCVGHKGELIEAAVGDGSAFGLRAEVVFDPPGLAGTAGAVRGALPRLGDEFLVLYGDTYLRVDYQALQQRRRESGLPALMAVLRNADRWDVSNAEFDGERVLRHDKRHPTPEMEWIDYGVAVLTPPALAGDEPDLAEVYHGLAERGQLAGYAATERFYEIGSPAALAETDAWMRNTMGAA
jgi:NDP-sugar pyrophosphorylase family protein